MSGGADRAALWRARCAWLAGALACVLMARPAAASGFDEALAAHVFTTALAFMQPRILMAEPTPVLAAWGLRGISALDPALAPSIAAGKAELLANGQKLASVALPAADDLSGWGQMIAHLNAAAFRYSPALRRAGTEGLIASFFDEVFNHLDPYSRYVPPAAALADREWRRGAAGVGLTLAGPPGKVAVAGVVPQGPAARAGLAPQDQVIAIDGQAVGRRSADEVLAALDGEDGTSVKLTLRDAAGRVRRVTVVRAEVPADTVAATLDQGMLVVRVTGFTASTADLMRAALATAMDAKPQPSGIVLDLRGNRGGLLRQAIDAAELVLTRGVIATTVGRDPEADHNWAADGTDSALGLPIVVLVDGRTASAAEILAAALEDNGRAVVVGSATLGKGLVQTIAAMPDGGELFVTWSRVLAPAGWPLQNLGVMPEVCTSLGAEATAEQLAALNQGEQTLAKTLTLHRMARAETPLAEVLAIRRACPADLGHESDMDAARFLIANPVAYASALAPL